MFVYQIALREEWLRMFTIEHSNVKQQTKNPITFALKPRTI